MLEISAHGLNHFFATYRYQKIFAVFWLIVFALSASLCIVDFTALFRKYAKRHISTEIKLGHGSIPFPAVTVCNLNPFRKSAIAEYEGLAALNEAFLDINYENPTGRKKRGADRTVINVRRKRNIYPIHVKNNVSYAVGEAGASCDEACAAEGMSCVTDFPGMTDLSNAARQQLMKDAVNNEQTGVEAPSNTGCCHGGTYPSYDAALLLYGYDWHEGYTVPLCNSTAEGHNRLCECDGTSSATTTTAAVTTTAAGTTSAAATTAAVTTAAVTTAGVTTAAATTAAVTTAAVTTAGVTTAAATTAAVTTAGVTTAAATTAAVTTAAVTTAGVTTAAATTAAVTTAAVTTAAAATTAAATTAALTTITTPASPPVTPNFPIPSGFVFSTCDPGTACQNSTGCLTDAGSLQQYCVCELGWNGDQCDVNIDDCLSRPCLNGGVCIDGVNTYSCDCTDTGFSGLNCENDIDECIGNTCDSSDTCADYLGGYRCVSEPSITEAKERILGAETTTTVGDSEAVQINTQDLRAFMVLDLLLQTDWSSEGSRLGHLRSDFLKWCAYQNSTRCDELFATVDFDADLGNCFTFNQNGSKTVERAGQDSSLNVEVFLQQDAYLPQTSEVGALIVLHSSQTPIFATGETYKVAPGFHVNYDISYKKLRRLPPPWGTCVEHKSEVPHYFYGGIYTQQGCEKSQYQAAVIDTCGCGDPRYPLPPDASYCTVHDRACLSDAAFVATKTDSSSCQEACWGETWRVITTAAVWPQSSSIVDGCTGKECVSKFRKDNAKLSISYRTLTYLVYSEYPTYEVINLVSNLGSIVGVMIGMSVTSVFELLILSILRQHGNSPAAYKSAIRLAGLKTEE